MAATCDLLKIEGVSATHIYVVVENVFQAWNPHNIATRAKIKGQTQRERERERERETERQRDRETDRERERERERPGVLGCQKGFGFGKSQQVYGHSLGLEAE